jgi:glycosyltransferase involved in cell wall biosynthesis
MKIALSTSVIQRGKTGIAQYVFALVRALSAYAGDHQIRLYVLKEDRPLFRFADPRIEQVEVDERFRPAVKNILWHQQLLPGLLTEWKADVLHVPSYRRLLWRHPCPLVATIHDLAPFRIADKYDWKRMFYGKVVVRRLAWRQNAIMAISESTANDITTFFGIPRTRLDVVYNGIDHERFHPLSAPETDRPVVEKNRLHQPYILYVSRLEHPAKNHVRLIQAFERFKETTGSPWQLAFGGSDWHGAEFVHAAVEASRYKADIRLLGFVPDADLPALYRQASAMAYPSLYEGFGFPPVEAMACGCPVISSTRGSLGEVVGDAALTIDPENVDEMASGLCRIASDDVLRNHLRTAGLSNAKRFNWTNTASRCMAVYERVARHRT